MLDCIIFDIMLDSQYKENIKVDVSIDTESINVYLSTE